MKKKRREGERKEQEKRIDEKGRGKERRREKREEKPYLSEHNVEGKHFKEKVTSDR